MALGTVVVEHCRPSISLTVVAEALRLTVVAGLRSMGEEHPIQFLVTERGAARSLDEVQHGTGGALPNLSPPSQSLI